MDWVNPRPVFDSGGIKYAGPILVRYEPDCKPCFTKGYTAAFVYLATKNMHLDLLSDLMTSTFIATLQRFIGH